MPVSEGKSFVVSVECLTVSGHACVYHDGSYLCEVLLLSTLILVLTFLFS